MFRSVFGRICAWYKANQNRNLKIVIVCVVVLFGIGIFFIDYIHSATPLEGVITRNAYGKGSQNKSFDVKIGDEKKQKIDVEVSERLYSDAEIDSLFSRCTTQLETLILGNNKSLDHVDQDLNLLTKYPKEPVEILWECDRFDVINVNGELQKEQLTSEGTIVHLKAVLTYTEFEDRQAIFECNAVIYPQILSKKEALLQSVKTAIADENVRTQEKEVLILPNKISNIDLVYYPVFETRGLVLTVLAVIVGILLVALEKQNEEDAKKIRHKEMLRDYPEVVSKLTLLFGAGMTMKRSWARMVEDYEREKELFGDREIYEEMKITKKEMESGVIESTTYEHFGQRCELQEYIRLGALLSQNLRKGTKGLTKLLEEESRQALENRKATAKRLGEEAGTKLLAPMFLMLAVVLLMIIVPAFLSVQM